MSVRDPEAEEKTSTTGDSKTKGGAAVSGMTYSRMSAFNGKLEGSVCVHLTCSQMASHIKLHLLLKVSLAVSIAGMMTSHL